VPAAPHRLQQSASGGFAAKLQAMIRWGNRTVSEHIDRAASDVHASEIHAAQFQVEARLCPGPCE
jgi:hypothetical protein